MLSSCARDPRLPPYNVVAETATAEYLIQNARIELAVGKVSDQVLERIICNLGLALLKRQPQND